MTSIMFTAKDPARDLRPAGPVLTELVQELERIIEIGQTPSYGISDTDKAFYQNHPLSYDPRGVSLHQVALWLDTKINPPLTLDNAIALAADDLVRTGGITLDRAREIVDQVITVFGLIPDTAAPAVEEQ